jgi:hypothetical protein
MTTCFVEAQKYEAGLVKIGFLLNRHVNQGVGKKSKQNIVI